MTVNKNSEENPLNQNKLKDQTIASVIIQSMQTAYKLQQAGKIKQAEALYQKVLSIDPFHVNANHLLGVLYLQAQRYQLGIPLIRKSIAVKPDFKEAYSNLGLALSKIGLNLEAIDCFRKAIDLDECYAEAYHNLGLSLKKEGELESALVSLTKAVELNDKYATAHNSLALIFQDLGRTDDLVKHLQIAIDINPNFAVAYRHLASAKKYAEMDHYLNQMEALFESKKLPPAEAKHLAFGLGKVFEDLKQPDKSFRYYAIGNSLHRQSYKFDVEDETKHFANIEKTFNHQWLNNQVDQGISNDTPIFIVGMPRSGSSLVEQILSSHSHVYGAGELTCLQQLILDTSKKMAGSFPSTFLKADGDTLKDIGETYINELRKRGGNAKHITDKLPHNFLYIGLIATAIPNAKIIHIRREPMDTCFSIYKHFFQEEHPYAYDLAELAQHYKNYERIMGHWNQVLPGKIFNLRYEDLVKEPKAQIETLLEHCGLLFEDNCLKFYQSDRPVETASALQVRKPLYKSAVRSWKQYEKHLKQLHQSLSS